MRIKSFLSRKLNGYLDFNLRLNDGPSFLIGINGSGKTSVLRATMALLSPDIDWIMGSTYDRVEVEVEIDLQNIVIRSESVTGAKVVSILMGGEPVFQSTITEDYYKNMVRHSRESLYFEQHEPISVTETLTSFPAGMEALDFIKQLPTPIYLGLDRSTLPTGSSKRSKQSWRSRQPHATLRTFLDESVAEAEAAAVNAIREAGSSRQNAAVELRKKILLTLFLPSSTSQANLLPAKQIRFLALRI